LYCTHPGLWQGLLPGSNPPPLPHPKALTPRLRAGRLR
jgi:hypothetical protein